MQRPWLCLIVLALLGAGPVQAQTWPARPVRIIVATTPGGGYDFIGRLLAERLTQHHGQPFVVDNRPGSGAMVGTDVAAKAAPDGHTLLIGGLANMAFAPGINPRLPYDSVADFTPVALVGTFSYTLITRRDSGLASLKDVIERARAQPGRLTIATAGTGTGQHIAAVMLKRLAGVDILEVPFKGAQPAYTDLFGGRIDLFFDNTATAKPFIDAGRARGLATSGDKRDTQLPDVPTAREAGVGGLELESWIGLFAPAKTPPAIIESLRGGVAQAMAAPETVKRLETAGWRTMTMPPKETEAFVRAEAQRWTRFLREAGIKAE